MYKKNNYIVTENCPIAKNVFKMVLKGDTQYITRPGQFINIKVDNCLLRRPISVCDYDEESIMIIYKVVGHGTGLMSEARIGTIFDVLTGLGNGYSVNYESKKPLLIGGGVGVPPLYGLCRELAEKGRDISVILGFNTKEEVFFEKEFKQLGARVIVTTIDASFGKKGFVTDALSDVSGYDYYYTCGPEPMLKAVYGACDTNGQLSFEERMGCGFGACMGCSCKTKYGSKRICKEGPVLKKEEVIW